MIDIGANLTNAAFDGDREAVVSRAVAAGVTTMIVTGTSVSSSHAAAQLAATAQLAAGAQLAAAPTLYATAGVHPHDAGAVAANWIDDLATLAAQPHVVAVGETGLDYYRNYSSPDDQRTVFRRQVELAVALGKPLFVHDRDSNGETRALLADYRSELTACVIHCFTGSAAELDGYLEDGYSIGVTGWICDERRGVELAGLVRRIPADRLMIETDAPYLLPRTVYPKPSGRRNEPAYLSWVARKVAECRDEDFAVVAEQTHENAKRFFRLAEAPSSQL